MQADNTPAATQQPEHRPIRWGKISLLVFIMLLAGIAATVVWLINDTAWVKTLTGRAISSLTGRELSINGAFDFKLGPELSVTAEQVTWANAPWSNSPAMLSVGTVRLTVDARSILQPPLLITQVAARDVQLYFEWGTDGQSNWQLGAADKPAATKSARTFEWLLEAADLQNIDVHIRPAGQDNEVRIQIAELKQQQSTLDLHPGQEMTLSVSGINGTSSAAPGDATLLRVADLEASFDFDSLMQAPLIITDIAAKDAEVYLEWDADGRFNWQFGNTDDKQDEESAHPLPVLLDKVKLQDVALRVQHPSQVEDIQVRIAQMTQQQNDSQDLITDIDMTVEGMPLTVDGRIGPYPELLTAGAVNLDLKIVGLDTSLTLQGDVADLASMQKPNLKLTWLAPEVEKVLETLNLPIAASGKADLRGVVTPVDAGLEAQIEGSIGEFALNGSLHTENINQLEGLSLSRLAGLKVLFQSTGPSALAAGKVIAIDGLPPEPYELDIQVEDTDAGLAIKALRFATAGAVATGTGLVPDFPAFTRLDFDLQMNVPNIARFSGLLPGEIIPALPFSVDGKIRSNTDNSKDSVTASAALGPLKAKLTGLLTETPRFAGSTFDWTLTSPDAQRSGAIFDIRLLQTVPIDASGKATLVPAGLNLRNTVVKLGTHTAKLNGDIPLYNEAPIVQLDGNVSGSNLRSLVNLFTATDQIPELSYNVATKLRYAKSKLELQGTKGTIGSNTLKADGSLIFGKDWPVTDLRLSVAGPRLTELLRRQNFAELPTGSYSAGGGLKITATGGTRISQLYVETDSGVIRGSLDLGWPAEPERIDFDLTAKGTNLAKVVPVVDGYEPAAVTFDIAARGQLNKQQVDIPQLTARLGDARINVQGNLDFSSNLRSNGAVIKASGPRLSDLGTLKSWSLPEGRFDLSAAVAGAADKLKVSDFSLKFGPSDLRGSLQVTRKGKPQVEIIASSNRLDVRPFEELYFGDTPAAPTNPQAGKTRAGKKSADQRLIPGEPVPLEQLNSIDGSVQLSAAQLTSHRFLFQNLDIKARLTDGNLDFDGTSSFGNNSSLQVKLGLQQQKGRLPHAEFNATARNVQYELNQLDQSLQGYNLIQNIDAYLIGDGNDLREIAANVNGYLWLRGGGQKVPTKQFGFFFGDFLTGVLDKINPFAKKEPYQTIQCVVAFFEATDGVLKTAPAALLSTQKMNVGAEGSINLKNEKIVMNVHADPRKGIGISASSLVNSFVGLRGTLSRPELSLDPAGTLIGGGAAVATGGLSILAESLYKRWFSSKDPCANMTKEAFKIRQKRDPAHVPAD